MDRLRRKPRVDYRQLADGPSIPPKQTETWSTKKFYELTVTDTRVDENGRWAAKYDEWRKSSDILDIPEEYLNSTDEAKSLFVKTLKYSIKEQLHGQRRVNSFEKLRVPIVRDIFSVFDELGIKSDQKIPDTSVLNSLF